MKSVCDTGTEWVSAGLRFAKEFVTTLITLLLYCPPVCTEINLRGIRKKEGFPFLAIRSEEHNV